MLCEVQMLLRDYKDVRTAMHEIYKIVRADSDTSLHKDFAKYQHARDIRSQFERDGNSDFNMACRDGLDVALPRLLADKVPHDLMRGLCTACKYVHPACVKAPDRVSADDLGVALRDAAGGIAGRDGFRTSCLR